jgi:two-component system cell cycle sensor histidine kinase/response regulator CckA
MAVVMVVDDEPDVLNTLGAILARAGHNTLKAPSGVAALDLLDQSGELDLLLTDVLMPGLNGFNLARMALMRRPSLKVVFLTGFFEVAQALKDPLAETRKLLRKPILPAELTAAVAEAIGGPG